MPTTPTITYRFEPLWADGTAWTVHNNTGDKLGVVSVEAQGIVCWVDQPDQPHLVEGGGHVTRAITLPWNGDHAHPTGPRGGNPVSPDAITRARELLDIFLADPDARTRQLAARAVLAAQLVNRYTTLSNQAAARIKELEALRADLAVCAFGLGDLAINLDRVIPDATEIDDHPYMPIGGTAPETGS